METAIIHIFQQHLDFLPAAVAMQLAQRFADQFRCINVRSPLEDLSTEELSEAHTFLFGEIKKLVRGDPRLDLRYPDGAITNVVVTLLDDLVRVAPPRTIR